VIVSNEEHQLLDQIQEHKGMMFKKDLDLRQQVVAGNLVNRDVLTRARKDGKICYVLPDPSNVWRI
jgi:hypothetical protein